jgi:putative MATE family efflux protein
MKTTIQSENQPADLKKEPVIRNEITEGAIGKQLLLFFFPILFGTFFQQLYNTADAVIVGRFIGKIALAAVGGTTGTILNLFVGFFVGLSSGCAVIIAQNFGARHDKSVSSCVHTAIGFSIVAGLFMTVVGIIITPFVLSRMQVPAEILGQAIIYLRIYFAGMTANLIYNMGAGILRAIGDSRRPLYFLIVSCFANIVLDLLFVVVFGMGVGGAAFATILSQLISAVLVIRVLMRSKESYHLDLKKITIDRACLSKMIYVGLPAGMQSAMYNISNIIIQASVNSFGTDTIAAWTAYGKIDVIYWMMINAFGISITTFVGQNFGAGKKDRIYKGIRICLLYSAASTVLITFLMLVFGKYIYMLFTSDAAVIEIGMQILKFLVPTFITYVCVEIFSGALRGTGDCWVPMIMTCLGVCVLRVVWILIAVPINNSILTVIFSYPLTWTVTSVLFLIYFLFFSTLRRKRNPKAGSELPVD